MRACEEVKIKVAAWPGSQSGGDLDFPMQLVSLGYYYQHTPGSGTLVQTIIYIIREAPDQGSTAEPVG